MEMKSYVIQLRKLKPLRIRSLSALPLRNTLLCFNAQHSLTDGNESICDTTQEIKTIANTEMSPVNLKEVENPLYYRRDLQLISFTSKKDVAVFECTALVT